MYTSKCTCVYSRIVVRSRVCSRWFTTYLICRFNPGPAFWGTTNWDPWLFHGWISFWIYVCTYIYSGIIWRETRLFWINVCVYIGIYILVSLFGDENNRGVYKLIYRDWWDFFFFVNAHTCTHMWRYGDLFETYYLGILFLFFFIYLFIFESDPSDI